MWKFILLKNLPAFLSAFWGLERGKERRATGHHWGTGVLFGWKAGSGKLELDLCCCEQ